MGRPIGKKFLGKKAVHQIQSLTQGPNDGAGGVAGYLAQQNSPKRFRATTVNGTSLTTLVNGPSPVAAGQSVVKVFPVGTDPTVDATATANLKLVSINSIVSGGANYNALDVLTINGGVFGSAAKITVQTVNGAGAILTANVFPAVLNQDYTALPNIAAVTTTDTTNANGSGATFSVNFGLESVTITNGGVGYTGAALVFPQANTQPTTAATVVGGVVQNTVTVSAPGVINVGSPTVIVEGSAGTTEYAKLIQSRSKVLTHSGNVYSWIPQGTQPPVSWATEGIKLAYLDTK